MAEETRGTDVGTAHECYVLMPVWALAMLMREHRAAFGLEGAYDSHYAAARQAMRAAGYTENGEAVEA